MGATVTRDSLAHAMLLVAESLAFFTLATVLASGAGGDGPAFPTVLLAMVGGFALIRALLRFDISPVAQALVGAGLTALVLLVLLNVQYQPGGNPLSLAWLGGFFDGPDHYLTSRWPQTWGAIVIVIAWFRAVFRAQHELTYQSALVTFSAGLILFVIALLFGQSSTAVTAINVAALPFFGCSLLALALIQIRRADQSDAELTRGPWLGVMIGIVGALAAISVLVGFFPLAWLDRLLAPVGRVALAILDLLILVIAYPIGWLATWLLSLLLGDRQIAFPQTTQVASDAVQQVQREGERGAVLAFFLTILKFLFVLGMILLAAYIVFRVFRRLRRPAREADEVRESVYGEGSLSGDLRDLFDGLLNRLRRGDAADGQPPLSPAGLRVRRIYLRALDKAAERGSVRPPAATPHEFSPTLSNSLDLTEPDQLSDRFAAARYGRLEPTGDEIASLERSVP